MLACSARIANATIETSVPSSTARNAAIFCVSTLNATVNAITTSGPMDNMRSVWAFGST